MGDRMRVIPFDRLANWVCEEYEREKSIFGIRDKHFYRAKREQPLTFCGEKLGIPLGPAAGPHTQLAQNLAAGYLVGGRFFELKTVQVLDSLEFDKPCINAADECYNTEWSTELSIEEALDEYIKGWFLLHLLAREYFGLEERSFVFNMSVGYDLEGIKSEKVDRFIEGLKNASSIPVFDQCKRVLKARADRFNNIDSQYIETISPVLCGSIALSTMHGCPPAEIEAICSYLILDKKLHTHVKLNPTLLGFDFVRDALKEMGYGYMQLMEKTFNDDLAYSEAVPMLKGLIELADKNNREFGVKLSNTLPVSDQEGILHGDQMYMSGKPLYALTINLASRLAEEFAGEIKISYSGGADKNNIAEIVSTGIQPVTVVTTLLKPNGYLELKKLAEIVEAEVDAGLDGLDPKRLKKLAVEVIGNPNYCKKSRTGSEKMAAGPSEKLTLFDCRASCGLCVNTCPNRANIAIHLQVEGLEYKQQIIHIDGMCNECGNCAVFCPEQGSPYLDKLTLFWNEEDFNNSLNSGFLLTGDGLDKAIRIRNDGKMAECEPDQLAEKAGAEFGPALAGVVNHIIRHHGYLL